MRLQYKRHQLNIHSPINENFPISKPHKIEQLAIKLYDDGWDFNQVICIAKGGLRVGDVLARIFDVPLAILSVESYKGDGVKNKRR